MEIIEVIEVIEVILKKFDGQIEVMKKYISNKNTKDKLL